MPTVKLQAPEGEDLIVTSRNTFTGADGEAVTIPAGRNGSVDIDAGNQVVLSVRASEDGTSAIPHTASVEEEDDKGGAQLNDATDEEVVAALTELHADAASERTGKGFLELSAVNKALEDKGFAPIKAGRRDELSTANNLVAVKPAT